MEITVHIILSQSLTKEYKIPSISVGEVEKISFVLEDKSYPKDLRIYVKGYYKKVLKNNLFICDYPLEYIMET